MERVRIRVVRSRSYHPVDGFLVYGDRGDGAIDWDRPLTSRKVLFWEGTWPLPGYLSGGHLAGRHLDGIMPEGHLGGTFLLDEHLQPASTVLWETDPLVFGRFALAVVTQDGVGNMEAGEAVIRERVVNSEPPPPRELQPQSFESVDGRLTLAFTPSERLVG
jgi:hypothetical protein